MAIPTTWWRSLKTVGNCQKLVSWSSIMIERNKHGEYARLSKTASFKKTYLKRFHTVDHQNQRSSSVHNKQIATVACAELESSCPCCSCFYYLQATMHTNMDSLQDFPPVLAPDPPRSPRPPHAYVETEDAQGASNMAGWGHIAIAHLPSLHIGVVQLWIDWISSEICQSFDGCKHLH